MAQTRVRAEAATLVRTRTDCRMCGGTALMRVWSFGPTPLANAYLTPEEAGHRSEPLIPLDVYYCSDCHLVQLRDVVSPEMLFSNYLYISSTSPTFVRHFEEYADTLVRRFGLTEKSMVVDVGSNDGVLLKPLQAAGARVLGIDPAANVAKMANEAGIETVAAFFTPALAAVVAEERGRAAVICANNVFAHTDTVEVFTAAVKELMAPDGVFVFEVQYLGDLVAKNLFDIVYHEHVCYYSLHPLVRFFGQHGMNVFDVERPPVHGGSLRVYVQHAGGPHARATRLDALLDEEQQAGLTSAAAYQQFARRIENNKAALLAMLHELKRTGKRIAGYGAPAKATTLCYALGIDGTVLDYIADDDATFKQGRLMPGTHIPIVSPQELYGSDKPDYCLILAWNFAEPIRRNHQRFTEQGGRFIMPVPEPKII
ncbi:MAG: class I SAM-dependent methyltransferase [Candidatus Andersenbacteria bacterium]|nr:class I SAM-dependent methyltransferase [Candidatus Andersenbacteria bacterium]